MEEEAYLIFSLRRDLVVGALTVVWLPKALGEVINLGSGIETRIIDLAKIILKLTRSKSGIEFYSYPWMILEGDAQI